MLNVDTQEVTEELLLYQSLALNLNFFKSSSHLREKLYEVQKNIEFLGQWHYLYYMP